MNTWFPVACCLTKKRSPLLTFLALPEHVGCGALEDPANEQCMCAARRQCLLICSPCRFRYAHVGIHDGVSVLTNLEVQRTSNLEPHNQALDQNREQSVGDRDIETAGHQCDMQIVVITMGMVAAILHFQTAITGPRALASRRALCIGGRDIFRAPSTETFQFVCVFILQYISNSRPRMKDQGRCTVMKMTLEQMQAAERR
jgi:hypothetical protein